MASRYMGTPLYTAWLCIKSRCNNPNRPNYRYYGGRGIRICARWDKHYEQFAKDMGPHPGKGWTIERVNNNKDYEPGNCCWATMKTQARNRRHVKLTLKDVNQIKTMYKNSNLTQREIGIIFGCTHSNISAITRGASWNV